MLGHEAPVSEEEGGGTQTRDMVGCCQMTCSMEAYREKTWRHREKTEQWARAQPGVSDKWDKAAQEVGDRGIRVRERRECPPL